MKNDDEESDKQNKNIAERRCTRCIAQIALTAPFAIAEHTVGSACRFDRSISQVAYRCFLSKVNVGMWRKGNTTSVYRLTVQNKV